MRYFHLLNYSTTCAVVYVREFNYRQISNIRRAKSQNLNVSRLVLQLSLPNPYILQWHHNEWDGVSNHRRLDCLLSRLFRRRSKKKSKFRVTGLCEGNSPVTGEFSAQRASNADFFSIQVMTSSWQGDCQLPLNWDHGLLYPQLWKNAHWPHEAIYYIYYLPIIQCRRWVPNLDLDHHYDDV